MEPVLNEQQALLRDSAVRLCKDLGGPKRARQLRDGGVDADREAWSAIVSAGWLATAVPEHAGGLGMGMFELSLAMEQAGRQLLMVPLVEAAAATWALSHAEPGAPRERALNEALEGKRLLVPALPQAGWGVEDGAALNARSEPHLVLDGTLRFVPFAASAQAFLVAAQDGRKEWLLCRVPRDAKGLAVDSVPNVDGSTFSEITLNAVPVSADAVLARSGKARELVAGMRDLLALGVGAELLGVANAALDMTLEHIKFRQQFGKPLGSFQALQHRAASCFVDIELNRSLVYRVFSAWDAAQCHPAMVSAVKARTSRTALEVTRAALQMHGAIGYTDEHDIGLYYKRAMTLAALYGNELNHTTRFFKLTTESA
jgi:alkylation response protein AidB-like acyl-CoA dehydrogenase